MHYRARSLLAGNHYLTFASLYALFCSEFSAKGDLPGNSSALINQLIICDQPIKLSTEVNSIFLCFCVALVYVHPGVEISIPLCMNIEGETHFNKKKLQLKLFYFLVFIHFLSGCLLALHTLDMLYAQAKVSTEKHCLHHQQLLITLFNTSSTRKR